MAHLVTGFSRKNHIKSADDGALNQAIIGQDCFVLEGDDNNELGYFGATIEDNNTVRIHSGEGIMYGRHFRIEPGEFEDLVIDNGQISMYRRDCIVATYEKDTSTGIESVYLEVIKGTPKTGYPSLPTYDTDNIYKGAVLCRMPLYDVLIDGVVLKSVNKLYKTQASLNSLEKSIKDEISKVNSNFVSFKNFITSSIGQQSEPILDRINNSMSNFGTFGAVAASDAPTEDEWCILWFGSGGRIKVIACAFTGTDIYDRSIFNSNWYNSWTKLH